MSDLGDGPPETSSGSGDSGVDEVLATLAGLEERPLEEHVGLFEQAHDRLRSVLAGARGDTGVG